MWIIRLLILDFLIIKLFNNRVLDLFRTEFGNISVFRLNFNAKNGLFREE